MKYYVFLFAGLASAQSVSSTSSTDLNGNPIVNRSVISTDATRTYTIRSINGGSVPTEQTTERVLSESPTSKTTEKITRRFDQNGNLTQTERIVTEQQKQPSGETVHVTTFQTDINGTMRETERKTVETTTHGASTEVQTEVARPTPSGFETVEKRSAVSQTNNNETHTDETVYRRSENGTFYPAFQTVTDTTQSDGKTVAKQAQYEPIADVSRMQLTKQIVTTTTTRPDGSSVSQFDYYGASVPGNVRDPSAPQRLYEQDTVERMPGAAGTVTETLTARRVSPNDPTHLGPPIPISQTVCTGNCHP